MKVVSYVTFIKRIHHSSGVLLRDAAAKFYGNYFVYQYSTKFFLRQ